jgi:predicted Fe-Mo cluster-binding NifX family protein
MKICITSQNGSLDGEIDSRFGRAAYFLIVNTDDLEYESIQNPYAQAGGGAGIQAAQFIANKQPEAVLTGNIGPNAFQVFKESGISVVTGVSGIVKTAAEKYNKGEFKGSENPTVNEKFGIEK